MAAKVDNVVQNALRCFTRRNKAFPETLQNDLVILKNLVNEVTVKDVKLLKFLLQKSVQDMNKKVPRKKIEPVEYIRIFENKDVSIGVFVLKSGAKLPIHDHPTMYGVLKVLEGAIKLTNYSVVGMDETTSSERRSFYYKHALKVIKHPQVTLSGMDNCVTLTPTERSIHEVECITGPAAFLDILAPPYEEECPSTPRGCHYFKELEGRTEDGYVRLAQIKEPTYWMEPEEKK